MSDRKHLSLGAMLLGLVSLVGFWVIVFHVASGEWVLTARSWQRNIAVEDFQPRTMQGWDETVPGDAYDVSCHRRKRRETCVGDVCTNHYDDYCTYTVDRWGYHRTLTAMNQAFETGDPRPFWPDLDFAPCDEVAYGCERTGAYGERYTWHLTLWQDVPADEAYTLDCNLTEPIWSDVALGSHWHMSYNDVINRPHCDTLEAIS